MSLSWELGPGSHFPLAVGVGVLEELQTFITLLFNLQFYRGTNPSTSTLCIDADRLLTCSIQTSIEGVMAILTSAILCTTLRSLLSYHNALEVLGVVPRQSPTQIAISPSSHLQLGSSLNVLESGPLKLLNAHSLTLVTPSLHVQEVLSMTGAFTHTRITWALSLMAPQISGVTPGSPSCPWCCEHSS